MSYKISWQDERKILNKIPFKHTTNYKEKDWSHLTKTTAATTEVNKDENNNECQGSFIFNTSTKF